VRPCRFPQRAARSLVFVAGFFSATSHADDAPVAVTVRGHAVHDPASTSVSVEEGSVMAGTQGDALKAVQALPGVVRPAFGYGPLIVWGAAPRDTRVYVDGVEVPALYHGGGIRGTVGAGLVSNIELVPGAYGPAYGRGLGGLVRVTTRALPESGVHGFFGADPLDASGMVSAAVTPHVRAAIAGRYGYLDAVLPALGAPKDLGDFVAVPGYDDLQAKVSWKLREHEQLSAVFLNSNDSLHRTIPSSDPGGASVSTETHSFQRFYMPYVRLPDDRTRVSVTPFYGFDHDRTATVFGGVPAYLDTDAVRYGVRAERTQRIGSVVSFDAGADVEGVRTDLSRSGSLTAPPREGDVRVFGQPPGGDVNSDMWKTHILGIAPYTRVTVSFGDFSIEPGLRFDAYLVQGSRSTPRVGETPRVGFSSLEGVLEPRLSARYRATKAVELTVSGGIYHAPPAPEDLSAVFGTPALTLSVARHAALGQAFALTDTTRLELVEYYEWLSRLPVRSLRDAPSLARALVQDGEGRSYGVQVLLRQQGWAGLSGFIAYTLGRSERNYVGSNVTRPFDYDRTHVLSVIANQELGEFTFGARVQYATGLPRTEVTGAYYDVAHDRYEPLFGTQNAIRLPAFFQLDLRADRRFHLGRGVVLRVYLEVDNLTARENAEEIVYDHRYAHHAYVTGMPPLVLLGGKVEF
jgi:hypothetical protein